MRFEDALRVAGLRPRDVVPDGLWHRCPTDSHPRKRNGAYKLALDGTIGWYRDWALGDMQTWRTDLEVRPIDRSAMEKRRAEERKKRLAATFQARKFWIEADPCLKLHPYLAEKNLQPIGINGLRVNGSLLVIPVAIGDRLVSIQTISKTGEKRFWPGASVKGGSWIIDRPGAAITAFCEGVATGLAVFQAVKWARVVVCFDAGNLIPVIQRMKPRGSVVICADNDHGTQERIGTNPGLDKARAAADICGAGIAYPEGIEGTDWCDYLYEIGQGAHRQAERKILSCIKYVDSTR